MRTNRKIRILVALIAMFGSSCGDAGIDSDGSEDDVRSSSSEPSSDSGDLKVPGILPDSGAAKSIDQDAQDGCWSLLESDPPQYHFSCDDTHLDCDDERSLQIPSFAKELNDQWTVYASVNDAEIEGVKLDLDARKVVFPKHLCPERQGKLFVRISCPLSYPDPDC